MAGGVLYVEGKDDEHFILHLLLRHAIDLQTPPVSIKSAGNDSKVLDQIVEGVKGAAGEGAAVGFVLDADDSVSHRWAQISKRLHDADIPVGEGLSDPPADGFVGYIESLKVRVGVWIMPDNQQVPGKLEDFVLGLTPESPLKAHAVKSTDEASGLGAEFKPKDKIKAILHCWLAWQEKPGRPYGTAMACRYFQTESPAANAFVEWYRRLFASDAAPMGGSAAGGGNSQ